MFPAYTTESEAALVARTREGDLDAFGEIVLRYREGMINVVYRMCGDAALAEDAAQTAFIKAWEHFPSYQANGSLRSWLYRIAVNSAMDMLRREKRLVELDQQPEMASHEEDPKALLEHKERRAQVQKAVLALPSASRAVLILREYEGLSYREIAETLEIPIGTVMSRLNYARSRLVELLGPTLEAT